MTARTQHATLLDTMSELLWSSDTVADQVIQLIRQRFPQVNERTKVSRTTGMFVVIAETERPVFDARPIKKTRRVRRPGYRWQFHRAVFELLDLPAEVEKGWMLQTYEEFPPPAPAKTRRLELKQSFGLSPLLTRSPNALRFGGQLVFRFAYDPLLDTLFITSPL